LRDRKVQEGGVTEAVVSINNKSENAIPTPVAIVGIPGGLEVRQDQLKELVKSGKIDAYEVNGREVVLYWRYIKARDKFDLPLSLTAAVPGTYSGPASRAYLYYTDEFKNWAPALAVEIIPKSKAARNGDGSQLSSRGIHWGLSPLHSFELKFSVTVTAFPSCSYRFRKSGSR